MFGDRLRLRVSSGFVLMAALVYFLDEHGIFAATVVAAAAHELGHVAAILLLGGRITEFRLELTGAALYYNETELSYGREALCALAGPAAGLGLSLLASSLHLSLLAGVSLSLSALNLLPCAALDGGRALRALLSLVLDPRTAQRAVRVLSLLVSACALALGLYVLWASGRNFSYLLTALWLFWGSLRPL